MTRGFIVRPMARVGKVRSGGVGDTPRARDSPHHLLHRLTVLASSSLGDHGAARSSTWRPCVWLPVDCSYNVCECC